MKKRFLSALLCLCMVVGMLPVSVFAVDSDFTIENGVLTKYNGSGGDVTIPSGVTRIGAGAFDVCRGLTRVTIPSGVTSIGDYAFRGCYGLTSITIPDGVTSIGERAFWACQSLTSIKIPDSVTSIGDHAFNGCSRLTSVNIPKSVTSIGDSAFAWCDRLTSVDIPDSVTSIGDHAFLWCSNLTSVTIPSRVTSIGDYAFSGCSSLASVTIPDSVTSIGGRAFIMCGNVTVDPNNPNYSSDDGVLFNKAKTVLIHCPISKNDAYEIPDSVTSIGDGAFESCSSLTSVTIPDSVTSISTRAFWACSSLTSVTIPDDVTSIEEFTFSSCRGLTSITIPSSVTSIGDVAFSGCTSLADVYYTGTRAQWRSINISSVDNDHLLTARIHCIDGLIDPDNPIYTVSYDPNGGTGTMADALVDLSDVYTFPACGFTAPSGKEFKAWQIGNAEYNPNDVYTVTRDTTVTAVWQDANTTPTQPVNPSDPITGYTLTGTITGHKGVTYTSVTAQLVGLNGSTYSAEVGAGIADKTGKTEYAYTVSAPAGQYNLEVEAITDAGGVVNRSAVVELTGNGQTKDINLPNGQAKVKVENKIETAALVGGLDELIIDADGEVNGEVTLTIGSVDNSDPAVAAIRNAAPGRTLEFMDISITKSENGVESAVTDTKDVTVEIVLAFDRIGKNDIAVYRYHDGNVDTLTTQASGDGEKIEVDDDSIAIYAKKFSVYAIDYTVSATDPVTPSKPTTPSRPSSSTSSSHSISIPVSITGGTVKTVPTSASKGRRVTLTVTPDSGYELNKLIVTDNKGNELELTAKDDRTYTFTMPNSKATVEAVFTKIWSNPFSDVSENSWYYDAVKFANENGLMSGVGNGLFDPEADLTRAQFAQILYNKEGRPAVTADSTFVDVAVDTWYTNAVNWAAANGIVSGYGDGRFGPNDNITREQLAVMLWRYAGSPAATNKELNFTDADKASGYALNALCWAVENGIINGYGNGQLGPQGLATRAQVAQMLKNYMKR